MVSQFQVLWVFRLITPRPLRLSQIDYRNAYISFFLQWLITGLQTGPGLSAELVRQACQECLLCFVGWKRREAGCPRTQRPGDAVREHGRVSAMFPLASPINLGLSPMEKVATGAHERSCLHKGFWDTVRYEDAVRVRRRGRLSS